MAMATIACRSAHQQLGLFPILNTYPGYDEFLPQVILKEETYEQATGW